jgi:hypothetical protein
MTIDTSGRWWIGTEYADVAEYVRALTAQSYPAIEVRQARCSCGHTVFALRADPEEGCAERTCQVRGAAAPSTVALQPTGASVRQQQHVVFGGE